MFYATLGEVLMFYERAKERRSEGENETEQQTPPPNANHAATHAQCHSQSARCFGDGLRVGQDPGECKEPDRGPHALVHERPHAPHHVVIHALGPGPCEGEDGGDGEVGEEHRQAGVRARAGCEAQEEGQQLA